MCISEVFEDIISKTQSGEMLNAIKERLQKADQNTYNQKVFKSNFLRENRSYNNFIKD